MYSIVIVYLMLFFVEICRPMCCLLV